MRDDDAELGHVLELMESGEATGSSAVGIAAAYEALFDARYDEALRRARSVPGEGYVRAVRRQIESLCTAQLPGGLALEPQDPSTLAGAMTVFHTSEAAHVVGDLGTSAAMLAEALAGPVHPRAEVWLRLALGRSLVFRGDVAGAGEQVRLAAGLAMHPLTRRSVWCMTALVDGLTGDPAAVTELAERLRTEIAAPASYADAGMALVGALGLVSCGYPAAAAELLGHGAGGPGLPLLPPALRAYGFDVLIEAATAGGNHELAAWILIDFERLDLGDNPHLNAARDTSRARVGPGRAVAHDPEGGLLAARAVMAVALAEATDGAPDPHRLAEVLAGVTSTDLRDWATRALAAYGTRVRPLAGLGWDRLTPTQQVVARLAASGLGNAEIARTLVVSRRTVESHVAAILDQLGVANRVGIVHAAHAGAAVDPAALAHLTPRQRQVASALVRGDSNAAIADELGVGVKAVEKHLHGLYRTLGVSSRAAAAALLLQRRSTG